MKKTEAVMLLEQLILLKEAEHAAEGILLKEQFHKTYESLKPLNVIKNVFKEVKSAPDLKITVITGIMALVSDFVVRKFTKATDPKEE